jgi:lysyl-tRNA synthetase class 1
MVKFEVKKKLPKVSLDKDQKKFLSTVIEKLKSINWDAENIHSAIYDTSEKQKIPIKKAFTAIYQIILGQEKGPRAGYFLSSLDKNFVLNRVKEAIK